VKEYERAQVAETIARKTGGLGWYPVPPPATSPLKDPHRTMCRIHVDIRPRRIGQPLARWTH